MIAQAESKSPAGLASFKKWLVIAGIIVAVAVGIAYGMKFAIAPLHADIRAIDARLNLMDERLERVETQSGDPIDRLESRIQVVEQVLVGLSESLTRVELLLVEDATE